MKEKIEELEHQLHRAAKIFTGYCQVFDAHYIREGRNTMRPEIMAAQRHLRAAAIAFAEEARLMPSKLDEATELADAENQSTSPPS